MPLDMLQQILPVTMKEQFLLRAVRAPGNRVHAELGLGAEAEFPEYRDAADRWQAEFDADADPVRVYVLDADKVPVYAAGARLRHKRKEPRR